MNLKKYSASTTICHYAENRENSFGAVTPPIFQTSLFTFKDYDEILGVFSGDINKHLYTRMSNPTTEILEKKLATIANAEEAICFSSGMTAISNAILTFLKKDGHVITIKNLYNPTTKFFNNYLREKMGIEVDFVSGENSQEFKDMIKENTCLIYLESPSTAVFKLQDIQEIVEIAKEFKIKVVIDNTWATPIFQKCINMGVDLEIHSLSKYINGHSDVVGGVVLGKKEYIDSIRGNELPLLGGKLGPLESWLVLRGLRTLPIRLNQHQENTKKIVEFLDSHNKIKNVNHPFSKTYSQKNLAEKQMLGYTGLLSFEIDTNSLGLKTFINTLKLFKIGVSWGGYESLVFAPNIAVLNELSEEKIKELNIPINTIRVSVGLEDYKDLIEDLSDALNQI